MPNLNNLEKKSFTDFKDRRSNLLQARREDIIYREDLRTGFFYALIGITISLAAAGGIYTIGKKLLS